MSASAPKAKKAKALTSHPPVLEMVKDALASSKDRKGTSLATIKKYVASHYKVDMKRIAPHLRRAIVHGVENGALVRVANKGTGASGSFKLANKVVEGKSSKSPKVQKRKSTKVLLKTAPTDVAQKKVVAPKAKASGSKLGKAGKAIVGVKVKKAMPELAGKAAKSKKPKKAEGSKLKASVKKSKGVAPKPKKQVIKRPVRS
ncbi:unnamed protein product [Hydatigera taeniaeformis]|uniref:H15 domain-containing protein n=1 Tax=Hydatigena taeniaeformis TaxID=6205 RepID=A0A0R3X3T4_HYDTA|nr:unnamed protein product [Hydatigera taeniaeformis]